MSDAFLTITEAVRYTGKSRRTLHRLAQQLAKTAPTQVMRERTSKGIIWRIHQSSLPPDPSPAQRINHALDPYPAPLTVPPPDQFEGKALVLAQQGYGSLMAMHHEVKVSYEALLHEKERRIQELTQALGQRHRSFWQRLFGG
jgi:hypothetical protein